MGYFSVILLLFCCYFGVIVVLLCMNLCMHVSIKIGPKKIPPKKISQTKILLTKNSTKNVLKKCSVFWLGPKGPTVAAEGCSPPRSKKNAACRVTLFLVPPKVKAQLYEDFFLTKRRILYKLP